METPIQIFPFAFRRNISRTVVRISTNHPIMLFSKGMLHTTVFSFLSATVKFKCPFLKIAFFIPADNESPNNEKWKQQRHQTAH